MLRGNDGAVTTHSVTTGRLAHATYFEENSSRGGPRRVALQNKKGRLMPPLFLLIPSCLLAAEQVLRNAGLGEDKVARGLELASQPVEIDVEQLPLPLAYLARDDHGLDVGAVHQ